MESGHPGAVLREKSELSVLLWLTQGVQDLQRLLTFLSLPSWGSEKGPVRRAGHSCQGAGQQIAELRCKQHHLPGTCVPQEVEKEEEDTQAEV